MKYDTMNTYRKGALLDSDAEPYELLVRILHPRGTTFTERELFREAYLIMGDGSMTSYALGMMQKANIIAQLPDGTYTLLGRGRRRVMTLLKYVFAKTR